MCCGICVATNRSYAFLCVASATLFYCINIKLNQEAFVVADKRWFKNIDELMVLACLSQKPCYCSEIVEFINSYRDDEHKVEHNTVYTAIYFLQNKKAVEEQETRIIKGNKRVYYNLTPAGKIYFERFLRDYRAYIGAAEDVLGNSTELNNNKV